MNGLVTIDSEFSKMVGFTSDKFAGYLWREGNRVLCTILACKNPCEGEVVKLFQNIEERGLHPCVPNPSRRMRRVLRKAGCVPRKERLDSLQGEVELWGRNY